MSIKKHVCRYLKQIFKVYFFGATIPTVFVLVIAPIVNCAQGRENSLQDVLGTFAVFYGGFAIICGLFSLKAIRFVEMIKKQEQLLSVKFDEECVGVFPGAMTCISNDWLVKSGEWAFHKKYIKKFRIIHEHSRGVSGTFIFYTVDGRKYKCAFDVEQSFIVDWLKNLVKTK